MINLRIEGMGCDHCLRAVRKALAGVAGVDRVVDVSLDRAEAIVEGDADLDSLIAALEEEGYRAEACS
jgi:copper chaperone